MRLASAALLLALGACATPPVAPAELSASVRQYRSDAPLRMLSVTTTNSGDSPLVVERVQLLARGFVAVPSAPVDVVLPPGDRVDVPVAYGAARCGDPLPGETDAARMVLRRDGEPAQEVLVRLSAEGGLLPRLRASECALAAVRAVVDLSLGESWVRRGDRLDGSLVLTRRSGDEPVRVLEAGGHIVFTVRGSLPAALGPGTERVEVPLSVTPTRCDGHALSQNSRGAVFPFVVAVGDGAAVQTPALAGPSLQSQLQELARDVCRV
ncbi:MAG: hypothetical protein EPN99_01670 [Frankiales bacterium]|nr:MAG: hypothetical protein EPN99_01670 [Frankiales bacterium]